MHNGILPIFKEKGMTSHDVVFKTRKILKMKKVGHSGTLDPEVDGVLLLLLGDATKVSDYVMSLGKSYRAEVCLGRATTTEDLTGEILEEKDIENINTNELREILKSLVGKIEQTPPIYSAVKVNGKKLYEYARAGKFDIEIPSRIVDIYKIELKEDSIRYEDKKCYFTIDVHCGKGTYIRTIATDIGKKLGVPSCMSSLTRTSSGKITAENCLTLSELEQCKNIEDKLFPKEYALEDYTFVELPLYRAKQVLNGLRFRLDQFPNYDFSKGIVFTYKKKALAIYYLKDEKDELLSVKTTFPQKID